MQQLDYLNSQIIKWKAQTKKELLLGPQVREMLCNFKKMNPFLFEKTKQQQNLSLDQIKDLQLKEQERDESLHILVIQSQSFPVIFNQEVVLVCLLRFRDWFRQCLLLSVQLNSKVVKPSKHFKHKLTKNIKKLLQRGKDLHELILQARSQSNLNADVEKQATLLNN